MNVEIHPKALIWPENILRFHLAFENAMDTENAVGFVALFASDGEPVHGAFVDLMNGLWTPDQKVLTVLFHPGRVKTGLLAHTQLGRALKEGENYFIRVSGKIRDATGNRLGRDMSFPFKVGSAKKTAVPPVHIHHVLGEDDSIDAIRITSDRPIDWLSARFEISVCDTKDTKVQVEVIVDADGTDLLLRPARFWPQGTIVLTASDRLEDVCGNRQSEPFENQTIEIVKVI